MTENFISNIRVENSRNIQDFDIPLSNEHRQHLIITGKNGSGKTSLLLEINKFLTKVDNGDHNNLDRNLKQIVTWENQLTNRNLSIEEKTRLHDNIRHYINWVSEFGGTKLFFSTSAANIHEKSLKGEFLLAFFDSKRHIELNIPMGINKFNLKKKYGLQEKANTNFIQYIVNLKADRSFARDDNETEVVDKIDRWFERLEYRLKLMFNVENLKLRFDRKTYNFDIITDKNLPFSFDNLSDGYSAIISIVTELLLRMEAHEVKTYDMEGVVIIDEIETHLHVDLQKKILPFLIDFFPKIQFIVTTHSPFVLSSIENTIICDLEKKIVTSDLTGYSYDVLIESYFDSDKYSNELKNKVQKFEELMDKEELTDFEKDSLTDLKIYLNEIPKFLSDELAVKLQQIKLKNLKR